MASAEPGMRKEVTSLIRHSLHVRLRRTFGVRQLAAALERERTFAFPSALRQFETVWPQ